MPTSSLASIYFTEHVRAEERAERYKERTVLAS